MGSHKGFVLSGYPFAVRFRSLVLGYGRIDGHPYRAFERRRRPGKMEETKGVILRVSATIVRCNLDRQKTQKKAYI